SAGQHLPVKGKVFISVRDEDKREVVFIAKKLQDLGFAVVSTRGTAKVLRSHGVIADEVGRYEQGKGDMVNLMTLIKKNEIALIINTPSGEGSQYDMRSIRAASILHNVPCITTLQGAREAVNGIEAIKSKTFSVHSLQTRYASGEDIVCAAS
ncbi:MAG TPA: carbamoyl phosphate synthase large subunit, partial [Candidatus Omnitrophota bacterium]|nr:carbamoyl phosphate synthase large subunit [Candidatus Omnitrophota bacterium]